MKSFTIRIDEKSLYKLHYIAGFEGRSANSQVLQLIKEAVEAYVRAAIRTMPDDIRLSLISDLSGLMRQKEA